MRVRHLLFAGIGLALAIVGGRLAMLAVATDAEQRIEVLQGEVDRISRDAASLLVLSQDYLSHGSARASRQWQAAQAALERALPDVAARSEELRPRAEELSEVARGLPALMQALQRDEQAATRDAGRRELLADNLVAETRRITDGAFDLSSQLVQMRRVNAHRVRVVTLVTVSAFATLVLLIAAVVSRRMLRPIRQVQAAAQAMGEGRLDARSAWAAADEFGELSAIFDQMAARLAERSDHLAAALQQAEALLQTTREAEARQAAGEQFLRQITDGLPMRVAYLDAGGRYRFVNLAHCRRFGVTREQVLGHTLAEMPGRTVDKTLSEHLRRALGGEEQRFEFEEEVGGVRRIIESRLVPDVDAAGGVQGVFAMGLDVTERHRAERALRETSTLLNSVLDAATEVSIIATTADARIQVFNRGAERLLGWTREEVLGQVSTVPFHDRDQMRRRAQEMTRALGRPVRTGTVLMDPSVLGRPQEWTYVRKDGSRVPCTLVVTAMHDADGNVSGYLGMAQDITQQKQHEESLRRALDEARSADRAKSQFLANMSHEIRTPMNAVIGLTWLLGQTALDDRQADYVGKIKIASRSLLALINDILDLSKIEAGELTLEQIPFSPREQLDDLADVVEVMAEPKGIGFRVDAADDLPPVVAGDGNRLHQVLLNLLVNAVKFTERGEVTLEARRQPAPAGWARLAYTVRDTGIGIPQDAQRRLFEPFAQADASTTRRFGGTGLGLSIVRKLVDAMGGTVAASSRPGQGSEFRIEIEFPELAADALVHEDALATGRAGHPGGAALAGSRILVVDDSDINLEVARRILEAEGARVAVAENGQLAVDRVGGDVRAFDAVLMDLHMPVLDGLEATRQLRAIPGSRRMPIIALTAAALTSERAAADAAGMDGFVTKPFEPAALVRTVADQMAQARRAAGEAAGPTGASRIAAAPRAPRGAASGVVPDGIPDEVPDAVYRAAAPSQPATPGWPVIPGIDATDVRARIGDDPALFLSMLGRLLDDFPDLAAEAPGEMPPVARWHKLSGSSGMLGAADVHRLAAEGEALLRRGGDPGERLAQVHRALGQALRELRAGAAPAIAAVAAARARADAARLAETTDAPTLPAAALADLRRALDARDLAALDLFARHADALRGLVGAPAFERLRAHVDALEFDAAARILASAGTPAAVATHVTP